MKLPSFLFEKVFNQASASLTRAPRACPRPTILVGDLVTIASPLIASIVAEKLLVLGIMTTVSRAMTDALVALLEVVATLMGALPFYCLLVSTL